MTDAIDKMDALGEGKLLSMRDTNLPLSMPVRVISSERPDKRTLRISFEICSSRELRGSDWEQFFASEDLTGEGKCVGTAWNDHYDYDRGVYIYRASKSWELVER